MNKPSSLEELSPKTTDNQRRFSMVAEVRQATPATVQKSLVPEDMYGRVLYFLSDSRVQNLNFAHDDVEGYKKRNLNFPFETWNS